MAFKRPFRRKNKVKRAKKPRNTELRSLIGRIVGGIVVLAVCVACALFVNDAIGYLPLVAYVLVVIVSFAYLQVLKRSFTYSEDSLASSCERGSEIDFVLNFDNNSPLVFLRFEVYIYISDLFGSIDDITPVSLTLMPHEKREFHFDAQFDHIGTYSAGVSKIVISDLLGLFTHTIKNENRHYVEVLPRLFSADNIPLSSEATSDSQKPRQALTVDDMDYAGVRDYVWGDPIKTIHWKLSARNPGGEYLTRLFEAYNNPGVAIILDTSSPEYDSESLMFVFDGIVEAALSANEFALAQGIDSVLEFRNKYGEDAKLRLLDYHEFPELTDILPRIAPGAGDEAVEMLRREGGLIHGQDNIIFCTSQVNEEALSLLVSFKMHKRNPVLLLVVPPSMDTEEVRKFAEPLRRLDEVQVPHFVLRSAADLGTEIIDEEGEQQ